MVENADGHVLGSTLNKLDMTMVSHFAIKMMSPSWLFWLFGAYTQMVLGIGTFTAMAYSFVALVVRFVREFTQHGWDGGRTLGRAFLSGMCILMTPVVFVYRKATTLMEEGGETGAQQLPPSAPAVDLQNPRPLPNLVEQKGGDVDVSPKEKPVVKPRALSPPPGYEVSHRSSRSEERRSHRRNH